LCPTRQGDVKQAFQQQGPQPPCGTQSSSRRHTWLAYQVCDTIEVRRLAQLAHVGVGALCPTRQDDVKQAFKQQSPQPPCGTQGISWRHTSLAYSICDTLEVRRLAQLAQVGCRGLVPHQAR
jgi:hypothetical protein